MLDFQQGLNRPEQQDQQDLMAILWGKPMAALTVSLALGGDEPRRLWKVDYAACPSPGMGTVPGTEVGTTTKKKNKERESELVQEEKIG